MPESAPIYVCLKTDPTALGHGTCVCCHAPVVLWPDALRAPGVTFCVLCFLVHADAGAPWQLHPGTLEALAP